MNTALNHLKIIKVDDEYETPGNVFRYACRKYDVQPQIDAACNDKNKKCEFGLTNSLNVDWLLDTFINPPYSRVKEFMKKAYDEHKRHNTNVMVLVYAKTETRWWWDYVEGKAEVHFIKGRIKFLKDGAVTKYPAPYGSCWVIYRKKENVTN